ncbi:hypothetical protein BRC83_00730 [Halobacteriales archaeon QS_1_68_17]|nr:MAG: hypothetical protein BRC83_00730 [Halobacteriales archaeon QS_1_68_17]
MALQFPWVASVYAVGGIVAAIIVWVAWRHRYRSGSAPLGVLAGGTAVWAAAALGHHVAVTAATELLWLCLGIAVSGFVVVAWLVVVVTFTGREDWENPRGIAIAAVEPTVVALVVLTAGAGRFVRPEAVTTTVREGLLGGGIGLFLWIHVSYTFLLVGIVTLLVGWQAVARGGPNRERRLRLVVGVAAPFVGGLLWGAGLSPGLGTIIAGFVVTGTVFGQALRRNRLLDVAPSARELAREAIVDNMDDKVFVVDEEGRIVDLNPAAGRLLDASAGGAIGEPLSAVLPEVETALAGESGDGSPHTDLRVDVDGVVRYYDVRVSSLSGTRESAASRIVSLREVTARRTRTQRLDVLTRLLRHNLRNDVTVIRGNATAIADETDDDWVHDRIAAIVGRADDIARRSRKFGAITSRVDPDDRTELDLASVLRDVVAEARRDYPNATVSLDAPESIETVGGPSLEIAFAELVTNAIEHNDADEPTVDVSVVVNQATRQAYVHVADDGPPIPDHQKRVIARGEETQLEHATGVGLWLVNWAVAKFGGTITFPESADGNRVTVQLPLAYGD